jgi:hypothetical protein
MRPLDPMALTIGKGIRKFPYLQAKKMDSTVNRPRLRYCRVGGFSQLINWLD